MQFGCNMKNKEKDSVVDLIEFMLTVQGCFMLLSSVIWTFTNTTTDKWFSRLALSIICFGFVGIIRCIKK
jgi:hypothetical protein